MKLKYLLIILFFSISLFADTKSVEGDIQKITLKILNLCKINKFDEASKLIAYHGLDKSRENKDYYRINVKEEKFKVKRVCRKIRSLELISKNYEFDKFQIIKKNGVNYYSLKIKFKSSTQTIFINFIYVNFGKTYLLSDID